MTDSCMSIRTLTVQKDNSVIIYGPDLQPQQYRQSSELHKKKKKNPLVKTYQEAFSESEPTARNKNSQSKYLI